MSNKKVLRPINKEVVSSKEFLIILEKDRNNIKKSRFIPPKLGSNGGFGFFEVEYKLSQLR
ncbi:MULTISPECIES: hypothetical protein [Ignatzschineria]|uniref:Uncharacterized protein n=1 Tax=Ignatzschineria cameli TaxID=2182793 RepID=A0A2U2AST3_9GAMM|nr:MULTISPECIES: hypothetical protein [Ignatzschineria]OYQ81605.1 hypothetical protein B9T19_02755 [Ignatzschineria sp. F8392]PWD86042.1 hypothetical protein DC080_04610 [Ignatzschineria cameli]PWD87746.1 hypothetical protein DC077_00210 [Ignatzschineria cameli]